MTMTTKAKIILAGMAAATIVGSYALFDKYVGAGNAAEGVKSVFVQDLGKKAQGLEAELEKAADTEQYNPQLVSLLNRLYQAVPEENRVMLARETVYQLGSDKRVEFVMDAVRQDPAITSPLVRTAADKQLISPSDVTYVGRTVLGRMGEEQRYSVISDVVAGLPYTTTSELTFAGINRLNDTDLSKALRITAGNIGERVKDDIARRLNAIGNIFKLP